MKLVLEGINRGTGIQTPSPGSTGGTILVSLRVYDVLGRVVSVLVNDKREAGLHEVRFDGTSLASGVYLFRLQADSFTQTRRLVLLR